MLYQILSQIQFISHTERRNLSISEYFSQTPLIETSTRNYRKSHLDRNLSNSLLRIKPVRQILVIVFDFQMTPILKWMYSYPPNYHLAQHFPYSQFRSQSQYPNQHLVGLLAVAPAPVAADPVALHHSELQPRMQVGRGWLDDLLL